MSKLSQMDSEELAGLYDRGDRTVVAYEINKRPEYFGGVYMELRDRYEYTAERLAAFEKVVKRIRDGK